MDLETKAFYDGFWPRNVPVYERTREYLRLTVAERGVGHALDAGCGHGLFSIALAELADQVTAVDLSSRSLELARDQARQQGRPDIEFIHEDLQALSLPDETFDLVWCWGVAMMAPDPERVLRHLMRVTKPRGVLYLGMYLKTWLSPVHQAVRHFCRTFMNGPRRKRLVLRFFTALTRTVGQVRGRETNVRTDIPTLEALVDDWYYPPFKTFYSVAEITSLLSREGFDATCVQDRLGRMKSATIFVVKAVKREVSPEARSRDGRRAV